MVNMGSIGCRKGGRQVGPGDYVEYGHRTVVAKVRVVAAGARAPTSLVWPCRLRRVNRDVGVDHYRLSRCEVVELACELAWIVDDERARAGSAVRDLIRDEGGACRQHHAEGNVARERRTGAHDG